MNLLVDEIVEEITLKWKFPKKKTDNPILLIMAGYQGTGKTTALKTLQKDLGFIVISPDEIRHKLFSRGFPFSSDFVKTVNDINTELIKKAFDSGHSFALDHNVTPERMQLLFSYVEEQRIIRYKIIKVLLTAPMDVLIKRLEKRPEIKGVYKGKIEELCASVKEHGELDPSAYDLVIDTCKTDRDEVVEKIKKLVT